MIERLEDILLWFQEQPERIANLSSSCLVIGFVLLIAGLWGRVAIAGVNAMNHLGKITTEATLASIYPGIPTWWIPESFLGFLFVLLLLVYGGILQFYAKKYKRIMSL